MSMIVVYTPDTVTYEVYCESSRDNFYRFMEGFAEVMYKTELLIDCDDFIVALQKKLGWIIDIVEPNYDYEFSYGDIELMIDEMEDREIEENGD